MVIEMSEVATPPRSMYSSDLAGVHPFQTWLRPLGVAATFFDQLGEAKCACTSMRRAGVAADCAPTWAEARNARVEKAASAPRKWRRRIFEKDNCVSQRAAVD